METRTRPQVTIVGCGIVGAMVAYELSLVPSLQVQVLEKASYAEGSTGAALGVLMGIISHKVKGRTWHLRRTSIERYRILLPQLKNQGWPLQHNTQGVLSLCFEPERLEQWRSLQATRQAQGWPLEIWPPEQLAERCPHIDTAPVVAAIYSPCDGQVDPHQLTGALVEAAQQNGAVFQFGTEVSALMPDADGKGRLTTSRSELTPDQIVLAGGLGTAALAAQSPHPVSLIPVLGQAARVALPHALGDPQFQPVINGHDVHLVPLGSGHYHLGATVEFPPQADVSPAACQPDPAQFEQMQQTAAGYCPALTQAQTLRTWHSFRPRPQGQPAPVIAPLAGFTNVTLATGHYRNGVLLAPATALAVKAQVLAALGSP